jgi:autotransporter-associated beta strand protein
LTKDGLGVLSLGGSNSYSGGTVVKKGTLIASTANSIPTESEVTVESDAALNWSPAGR